MKNKALLLLMVVISLSACATSDKQNSSPDQNFTLGLVQRSIRNGMPQADVVDALGSPNIVTKDGLGQETWVYDKIASEASYQHTSFGAGAIVATAADLGSTLLLGIPAVNYGEQAGNISSSQRTLTVVIKFDGKSEVSSTSYHSSAF